MNQHGDVEIFRREHLRDVVEVTSDLVSALGVFRVIRANIHDPALIVKLKVVRGFFI